MNIGYDPEQLNFEVIVDPGFQLGKLGCSCIVSCGSQTLQNTATVFDEIDKAGSMAYILYYSFSVVLFSTCCHFSHGNYECKLLPLV